MVLVEIKHPALDKPIFASSDNAVCKSLEPLGYATRSTWLSPDGEPRTFPFVLSTAEQIQASAWSKSRPRLGEVATRQRA